MSSEVATKKGGFHYAFLIVASGLVITSIPCALVLSCAGIFFSPVSTYFGVATADFTLYYSILNIFMMIGLPIGGKLITRYDVRIVTTVYTIVCGVGYIAMSTFSSVWMFYIAGAIMGFAVSPLVYLAVPTLVNTWCKKNVGFFIGIGMVGTGLGAVIFNPIGTALINMGPDGWRMGYLVFGIVILVVTLPFTMFVLRSRPEDKGLQAYGADEVAEEEQAAPVSGVPANRAMKSLAFVAVASFAFLITLNQTVYQFLPSYCASFADTMPGIAAMSGVVASACMAGQAIGKVVLGAVNDRNVKLGLVVGLGGGACGVLLMWFVPSVIAVLMVGAFLFGFAYACTTVQTTLITREAFGSLAYTEIYSRVSTVGVLASAFATLILSMITDQPNGFMYMFILSLALMAACFCLGLIALNRGKKIPRETAEPAPVKEAEEVEPEIKKEAATA